MLTDKEGQLLIKSIKYCKSPATFNDDEAVLKKDVIDLIGSFIDFAYQITAENKSEAEELIKQFGDAGEGN